jgi:hypothetical protein
MTRLTLARRIADQFAARSEVVAVALSGSSSANNVDDASDIDLYVYTEEEIQLDARIKIMKGSGGASRSSMGLNFWGPGDEWFDAETGIEVDIVYFDFRWLEDQLQRVILDHQPSMGYSTCFWYLVNRSQVFYDPDRWFGDLQLFCNQPYPEALRQNIINFNHPVLREIIPSYFLQIKKATKRGDLVSINHRLAGLLASYFDILFAVNHQLHPGEKRLVQKVLSNCALLPVNMENEINAILIAAGNIQIGFLGLVSEFLDHLDQLLRSEGLISE